MKKSTKQLLLIGGLGVGGYFAYKWWQGRQAAEAEGTALWPGGYGAGAGAGGGFGLRSFWGGGGGDKGPNNLGTDEEELTPREREISATTEEERLAARRAQLFGEAPTGMGASRLAQLFGPGATEEAPVETGYGPTLSTAYGGSIWNVPEWMRPERPAPITGWAEPRTIAGIVKGKGTVPSRGGYGVQITSPYAGPSPALQARREQEAVREAAAATRIARSEDKTYTDPRSTMAYQATQARKAGLAKVRANRAIEKLHPSATKNALKASISGPGTKGGTTIPKPDYGRPLPPRPSASTKPSGIPPRETVMSRISGMY